MKKLLAMLLSAAMAFGAVTAFAELPRTEKTDRFTVTEADTKGAVFTMISADGELVIHINGDVPVIFEDGTGARARLEAGQTLPELLDGRLLTVTYSITTMSIPPQTTPEKIVVMYEIAVPLPIDIEPPVGIVNPIYEFTAEEKETLFPLNGEVVVDGSVIDAPAAYYRDGFVMVPLRAAAEALGYDVNWDEETASVRLGVAINFFIGKDYYTIGRMAPIELGAAPELTDGRTFVPLCFFTEVLKGDAYVFEGQVVITKETQRSIVEFVD